MSSGEDEVSRVRAESLGAVALLDKAEFGHELIPAILRLGAASKAADPSQLPKDCPDVDLLGAGAYNSPTTVPRRHYRSRWVQPPFSVFKTRDDGSLHLVEGAEDLESAQARVEKLAKLWPGEYVIVNRETGNGREAVHQHRRRVDSLTLSWPKTDSMNYSGNLS
jgi:hypothetical protein